MFRRALIVACAVLACSTPVAGFQAGSLLPTLRTHRRRSLLVKGLSLVGASLALPAIAPAETLEDYKLYQIFQDCKAIPGNVRFVAITAGGAVLETVGNFNYNYVGPYELTYPPYGMYMTIAGPNSEKHLEANFECTINLDKVTAMAFDVLNGPEGELYTIRLKNEAEPKPVVSIILAYDLQANGGKSGKYTAGAVEKWKEIRKKYADANGDIKL